MKYFKENKVGVQTIIERVSKEELIVMNNMKYTLQDLKRKKAKIEKEIAKNEGYCKHVVLEDLKGFPYDCRQCAACGKNMGYV